MWFNFADAPVFEPLFSSTGVQTVVSERAPEGTLKFACGESIETIYSIKDKQKLLCQNVIMELHQFLIMNCYASS